MNETEFGADCPDCGTWHYRDEACPYCYERVDRFLVKFGNKVLYRGYDEQQAERAFNDALGREEWRVKWHTECDVLINRRADHPYEG